MYHNSKSNSKILEMGDALIMVSICNKINVKERGVREGLDQLSDSQLLKDCVSWS
jgi:hypothetical protein